jgi:hypothetical protein
MVMTYLEKQHQRQGKENPKNKIAGKVAHGTTLGRVTYPLNPC